MLGKAGWATILKKTVEDMHPVASKSYRWTSAVRRWTGSPGSFSAQRLSRMGDEPCPAGFQSDSCEGKFLAGIHLVAMRRDGT